MILSCPENLGDRISTLSPLSMPFLIGVLTAVLALISFITQNSVCVSFDRMAELGSDMVFVLAVFTMRARATRFSGIWFDEFTLITTPCVCDRVSTAGINDATLPFSLVP